MTSWRPAVARNVTKIFSTGIFTTKSYVLPGVIKVRCMTYSSQFPAMDSRFWRTRRTIADQLLRWFTLFRQICASYWRTYCHLDMWRDQPNLSDWTHFRSICEVNDGNQQRRGNPRMFFDCHVRKVRVRGLWGTGDSLAVAKKAGLMCSNGKSPCRDCEIQGVWEAIWKHHNCPSERRRQRVAMSVNIILTRCRTGNR